MSDNIKVVVKVRPLISREIEEKLSYQWRVKNNTLYQLDQNGKDQGQSFTFDQVYDKDTKTSDVYDDIAKPIVQAATAGFNGTIFAYGQTSSGKTYTMTGTDSSPGIIPLAVLNLFELIKNVPDRDFLVRVSYIEIYNETVKDLLNVEKKDIRIHESLQGGVKVDVTEKVTSSPEEVLEAMREGEANRQKGATNMNELSSRSHSIFQITIESREHIEGENEGGCVNVSQLNLVDLAGSERAGQTGATGLRFKEGTHINKSLSVLALVIKQLSEDPNKYANYRDSKLTRILQNSLGGNAKTSIICAVTPAAVEETISTLQFANRAKAIKNKPEVNAVATDATMIQRLTKQMSKLQSQLESKKNLEQDNYNLQKQITALQRLILNSFGQNRSIDMMQGTRRKLQQPRRVTIHSTVSTMDDEPVVNVPKFCTPSLKYNPLSLTNSSEFLPIPSTSKLASVPEEPARLITPPPIQRTVNFNDEVIELDSDDDSPHDQETCSPIHKCYGSSKTPPCILRKNAKLAEKNLRDIVELTEREKIFSPSAVELMEKLEENSTVIAKLRDDVETLNRQSKEKDCEVLALQNKIKNNENELQALCAAKLELQTQCDDFNTKLTDWEVSYETLKNKAKLREEELLSLLEEGKVRKAEDIGKVLSQTFEKDMNFMDMSKDISLVNSDNENSVVNPDDVTENVNRIGEDNQAPKSKNVIELEADIFAYKQNITSLENLTQELNLTVSSFKEKLSNIETENTLLKSTIDTLNTTISNQKENLQSANNDIQSYNHVIQELQIKLTQRDNFSKMKIDDDLLENMIATEEKFIANNENMVNIIQSFRNALDVRNKEIAELKNKSSNEAFVKKDSLDQLQTKTEEINKLNLQVNENIALINKLMLENSNHKIIEEEFTKKLADVENNNIELEKINSSNNLCIHNLKLEVDEVGKENKVLTKQIEELSNKTADLQISANLKDELINSLTQEQLESKENLVGAKTALVKLQSILNTLSGNMEEVPEIIDNFVNIFSALSDSLNTLETVVFDIVAEKEQASEIKNTLNAELEELQIKNTEVVSTLLEQIQKLTKRESYQNEENYSLTQTINQLNSDVQTLREELTTKTSENTALRAQLNETIEIKNLEISAMQAKENQFEQFLCERDNTIGSLTQRLEAIENALKDKIAEKNSMEEQLHNITKHDSLANIFRKISEITNFFNIIMYDKTELVERNLYEQIMFSLNKIENHITFINLNSVTNDTNNIHEILTKAKVDIAELTHKNLNLEQKMVQIERKNKELCEEEKREDNNKNMVEDLMGSQKLLQYLQTELKLKAAELTSMENRVKKWQEDFSNLDLIMKQQINELKIENDYLKSRINDLKSEPELPTDLYSASNDENDSTNSKCALDVTTNSDIYSPPSLLTICCNKIVDFIEPKEGESKTTTDTSIENRICKCSELTSELYEAKEENSKILDLLADLECVNQHLLQEQEVARNEIKLLLEPAQELQKKILNHRTNLSILTATTYAENKSLKSQVKVLQHHHKRFHNVCQRDIPDFKKQLSSLMTLLKGDSPASDQQNMSFKRYSLPDVLDSSTTVPNFKNESTLDGDMLMLDTNITLTTAADNTLLGNDQTCLDMTQYYSEASCQTNDLNQISEHVKQNDIAEKLNILTDENLKLRELVDKYSAIEQPLVDVQNIPIKNGNHLSDSDHKQCEVRGNDTNQCINCKDLEILKTSHEKLNNELKELAEKLNEVSLMKDELEQKYRNIILETPNTEALVKKLNIFEKEYNNQKQEIAKLNNILNNKNIELKKMQEENDSLSNQIMDNITESDDLNKELDSLKLKNNELEDKCYKLEQSKKDIIDQKVADKDCSQCIVKDELLLTLQRKDTKAHAKLNRSLSDSDTSSRYNKICTLQSELHAGKEDCKELTEDVVTIKNHLERSNLSMDLDESMNDVNIYAFTKDFEVSSPQSKKCTMPDIPEERNSDIYKMDKIDCFNYYIEKTGAQKDNLKHDSKIVDVMKVLYETLITKHGNEVENLTNKLKDYEEAKILLQNQYYNLVEKHSKDIKELEEKCKIYTNTANKLSQIRNNINKINESINLSADKCELVNRFKENLTLIDSELDFATCNIFESLIDNVVNKHQADLQAVMEKYTTLQEYMETLTTELSSVNSNLVDMKTQLSAKEEEYSLLKAQKERVHEITNAVTLDIVKREKEIKDTIDDGYRKLIELNIVKPENVDSNLPLNTNINVLFELLVTQNNATLRDKEIEKDTLLQEISVLKAVSDEKQTEIDLLKRHNEKLQEVNNAVTLDLVDKDNKMQLLKTVHENMNKTYESKIVQDKENEALMDKLIKEVNVLKANILDKEEAIKVLENELAAQEKYNDKLAKISELIETVNGLQDENAKLKSINEIINKEKETYAQELKRSGETIRNNNIDLDKMTSDILVLRESVKENSSVIENLSTEAKSLLKQNVELKEQLEIKCKECSRLETNIKTHEKTAQIQTRMIMRLEKQKTEDDKVLSDTKKQLEELSKQCMTQQKQNQTHMAELEQLRKSKEVLETRITELEATLEGFKCRPSIDSISDVITRRRRQSLHDSKRTFADDKHEVSDHNSVEAVFDARPKPDDLFMDVDEGSSNRSTPIRLSKGRDSLSLSRTDQSDRDEEHPSRPSSVLETRRRRQTIHDSHRNELSHTPSPHGGNDSTVTQLRERLTSCQQELDELKEKYKELDEECETCSEYLKESEKQCARLKKEKQGLQTTITELKEKLQSSYPNISQMNASKPQLVHASVNTDEDWTNLHSVVVDRMSFDAEVEKNKKLTKTIEDLRFKKQDLKNTLAKMQKALEKNSGNRELEITKMELQACKQELSQLKERYKELDEECETCAQYMREKEEQCRRLKEAKSALEVKLQELQSEVSPMTVTARKKRQTVHDQNRPATVDVTDASTETSDDFLSYQVERDGNPRSVSDDKHTKEVKYLKMALERVSQQKSVLEQQLVSMSAAHVTPPAMYVATGSAIVQNQQITDVMKENQKLKKINAKLITICKKRGKESNRENEDPSNQG